MEAIHRLSLDRLNEDSGSYSSTLLTELRSLRQRKNELETRMQSLQESKKGLMVQLETLMKLLRNSSTSPRSTPCGSPRSVCGLSPTFLTPKRCSTSPAPSGSSEVSLTGLGVEVKLAFTGHTAWSATLTGHTTWSSAVTRMLRNDLHIAADSVTSALSSLVRELHSDDESQQIQRHLSGMDLLQIQRHMTGMDLLQTQRHMTGMDLLQTASSVRPAVSDKKSHDMSRPRSDVTDDTDLEFWGPHYLHWLMEQEAEFLAHLRARRQWDSTSSGQVTRDYDQNSCHDANELTHSVTWTKTDKEVYEDSDDAVFCHATLDEVHAGIHGARTKVQEEVIKEVPNYRNSRTNEDNFLQMEEVFLQKDDKSGRTDLQTPTRRWISQ